MGYELDANKYNYKCLMLSVLAIELIWIATETGLFAVEKSIMRTAVIPITIFSISLIYRHLPRFLHKSLYAHIGNKSACGW